MSQRADARRSLLLTAAGRAVCRAAGTTAWAVLADIALDAEADAHGNLVTATNVRCIAGDLGISKDTAARALSRLVDAGLVVRRCRRGAGGRFVRSLYELRLDPGAGVTVVAPSPCPTSPCPVLGDTVAEDTPSADAGLKRGARPDGTDPGPRRSPVWPRSLVRAGHRRRGAPVRSAVPVAVGAGLDHRGAHPFDHVSPSPVATHDSRNHALTVHHPELAYPSPTDTDDLTTPAPSALHHDHDQLTTTATTTATNHVHDQLTTTDNTTANHHPNQSRHWHPAVPFPGAAVTGAAEAARAAPC